MSKIELSERKLQVKICQHIQLYYPDVYFCSDSSGIYTGYQTASLLKNTRSRHAQLDITILERRNQFSGLIIECKKVTPFKQNGELRNDKHLEDQQNSMNLLESKGFKCLFCWSVEQAIEILEQYLGKPIIDNEPLF